MFSSPGLTKYLLIGQHYGRRLWYKPFWGVGGPCVYLPILKFRPTPTRMRESFLPQVELVRYRRGFICPTTIGRNAGQNPATKKTTSCPKTADEIWCEGSQARPTAADSRSAPVGVQGFESLPSHSQRGLATLQTSASKTASERLALATFLRRPLFSHFYRCSFTLFLWP